MTTSCGRARFAVSCCGDRRSVARSLLVRPRGLTGRLPGVRRSDDPADRPVEVRPSASARRGVWPRGRQTRAMPTLQATAATALRADRGPGEQAAHGLGDRGEGLVLGELRAARPAWWRARTKPLPRNGSRVRNIGVLLAVSTLLAARPSAAASQMSANANSASTPIGGRASRAGRRWGGSRARAATPSTMREADEGLDAGCRARGR